MDLLSLRSSACPALLVIEKCQRPTPVQPGETISAHREGKLLWTVQNVAKRKSIVDFAILYRIYLTNRSSEHSLPVEWVDGRLAIHERTWSG
jgi:hypothetical protein